MRNRVVRGIMCALLALSIAKPVLPVWAGAALVAFVALRAERDLRSPYARERWAAFKRMAAMALFGAALIVLGLRLGASSLPAEAASPAVARQILGVVALYCTALFGVPMLVLAHLTRSRTVVRRRVRVNASARTLSRLAAEGGRRMTRVAV